MTDRIDALRALEKAVEAGEFVRTDETKLPKYTAFIDALHAIDPTASVKAAMFALWSGTAGDFIRALIAQEGGE